jgi:uncharacterized protein (TIGR00288 family)
METRTNGPQIAVFIDFENVATSAEANFGDFDVTAVMDLLRTRGRLLIKRAYGDWGRFHRYRRAMLENGVDLFQLYSVGMQQKNRADVRLAIDALETVFTRQSIDVYAVISGDSDFTELIHKLRDHGKYTIGIGLRSATSDLLRRACDEFIFYETLVTEEAVDISEELRLPDARDLLRRALTAAEQKGELPIFAGRLKQIMLSLDSSFSETNYGYPQFRTFLEAYPDLAALEEQGLQLFVSMPKPASALEPAAAPAPAKPVAEPAAPRPPMVGGVMAGQALPGAAGTTVRPVVDQSQRYRSFLREAGLRIVELSTRQRVLADFLATAQARAEPFALSDAADVLKDRYDAENTLTQKLAVPDMMRLLVMSGTLSFAGGQACSDAPLRRLEELTPDILLSGCDRVYVWRLVEGGVSVDPGHLAPVIYDVDTTAERVAALCDALVAEGKIVPRADGFAVAPEQITRLLQRPELALPANNLVRVALPVGEPVTPYTAESLFREGSDLRQKDFAGSAHRYLQAARIQLDSLRNAQSHAGFDDLKWYLASYCSVKAGHAFVTGNYAEAVPYYLSFFSLAQESDSVWPRIQRLVNPMASYYFAIAGKQLNEPVPPNLGRSLAYQVALRIHHHTDPQVGAAWEELMSRLARVNLGLVRQTHRDILGQIGPVAQVGNGTVARIERTRAFLAGLIAEREQQE